MTAVAATNTDGALPAVSAVQAPAGGSTDCHAVAATVNASAGRASAVSAVSTNSAAPAMVARGPGTILDVQKTDGTSVLSVGQTGIGAVTAGAVTATSVAATGAVTAASVAATGAVSGATVAATGAATAASFTATAAVAGATLAATGAATAASFAATGAVTGATVAASGALSGAGLTVTTIGGTGDATITAGDLIANTAGKGLKVKEGSNARMGTLTLTGATPVVVATTAVSATSRIFAFHNTVGGTPGFAWVSARTAGTSFSVTGTAGDTSVMAWLIVEPA